MRKKQYTIPTTVCQSVESETLMLTATAGRTTTNAEAASGQQGGKSIPSNGYADENDVGAKKSPFSYDEYDSDWDD